LMDVPTLIVTAFSPSGLIVYASETFTRDNQLVKGRNFKFHFWLQLFEN
jgi:hypothetical protein